MPLITHGNSQQRKMIMSQLLCLPSSARGDASNGVAAHVLNELRLMRREAAVITRDLAGEPLPHADEGFVGARRASKGLAAA